MRDVEDVAFGLFGIDVHVAGIRRGHAQRRITHRGGNFFMAGQARDAVQIGLRRLQAARLDGVLIHPGIVQIADFLLGAARRGVRGRGFLNNLAHLLLGFVRQRGEGAVIGLVRRNFRRFQPFAVYIFIEIVARIDRRIHRLEVHAPFAKIGVRRGDLLFAGIGRRLGLLLRFRFGRRIVFRGRIGLATGRDQREGRRGKQISGFHRVSPWFFLLSGP